MSCIIAPAFSSSVMRFTRSSARAFGVEAAVFVRIELPVAFRSRYAARCGRTRSSASLVQRAAASAARRALPHEQNEDDSRRSRKSNGGFSGTAATTPRRESCLKRRDSCNRFQPCAANSTGDRGQRRARRTPTMAAMNARCAVLDERRVIDAGQHDPLPIRCAQAREQARLRLDGRERIALAMKHERRRHDLRGVELERTAPGRCQSTRTGSAPAPQRHTPRSRSARSLQAK